MLSGAVCGGCAGEAASRRDAGSSGLSPAGTLCRTRGSGHIFAQRGDKDDRSGTACAQWCVRGRRSLATAKQVSVGASEGRRWEHGVCAECPVLTALCACVCAGCQGKGKGKGTSSENKRLTTSASQRQTVCVDVCRVSRA